MFGGIACGITMLTSFTCVFLPFNAISRHRSCSGRRGIRFPIPFPRFSSAFSGHPNSFGTIECAAAASPAGNSSGNPISDAAADDTTILRTLSSSQKEQISVFVNALLEWNERMNLTSERQESEVMKRHVEDSLALLHPLRRSYLSMCCSYSTPSCDGLKLVDVGSGSGLPGLILAIACPTWSVTLLESMQKRCFFLEHVVKLTGLSNVDVLR
ncbi:uncharacterized protein LOC110034433, partial [Phalaenopsis equestris]|uniref:uncharacterized protein LOC110034433 n=1 Tax=Phalaenopsis equestris TaxID=78828 RepID=UPI0009E28EDB